MAQTEYKRRHDEVAKAVHWDLCSQDKWYEHKPEPVKENSNAKLLWDFTIQTDKRLAQNRPDIVLVDKNEDVCHIIDVASPGDSRIVQKEDEKVEKYLDLEIKAMWGMKKVVISPIVIGVLGNFTERLEGYLNNINIRLQSYNMQKTVLLASARIIRRVLER